MAPQLWSVQDVQAFVRWCCEEYDIKQVDMKKFHINGKGLCLLTKENICERIPDVGDVVYNKLLSLIRPTAQGVRCPSVPALGPLDLALRTSEVSPCSQDTASIPSVSSSLTPPAVVINPSLSPVSSPSTPSYDEQALDLSTKSPDAFPPPPSHEESLYYRIYNGYHQPHEYIPVPVKLEPPNTYADYDSSYQFVIPSPSILEPPLLHQTDKPLDLDFKNSGYSDSPQPDDKREMTDSYASRNGSTDDDFRPPFNGGFDSSSEKGEESSCEASSSSPTLNMDKSNVTNGTKASPNKNGKNGESESKLLWEFINKLLAEPDKFSHLVRWEDEARRVFRIVNTSCLAALWGQQKNRTTMTYEKLSRSLRYYYKMNIISKEPGRRLTYRFMKPPTDIPKGQRGAKPGVPHRPRGWRQRMKEEQQARRARDAAIARLQKEGADPETIAAYLAEHSLNVPSVTLTCEGHPVPLKDIPLRTPVTGYDVSRQPCFPDMPMNIPLKVEEESAKDCAVPDGHPNGHKVSYENSGIYIPGALSNLTLAKPDSVSSMDEIDSQVELIRQRKLLEKLQQAQFLRRRFLSGKTGKVNSLETKTADSVKLETGANVEPSGGNKCDSESNNTDCDTHTSNSNIQDTSPTSDTQICRKRKHANSQKAGLTPPPSFGRSASDMVPAKLKRYSHDDITVKYLKTSNNCG